MKPQTILFDLDDTLIHCNKYFDIVLDQFADRVATWFAGNRLSTEEIKEKQLEIDIAGVNLHGFTLEHFPKSLVETYEYYSSLYGRDTAESEKEELVRLGYTAYDQQIEPYPGMAETLDKLQADGHELFLYTGGVTEHQHKKINALELRRYFGDRIFVRQHKTAEALEAIVREQGFDRSSTWMIGNSIRTDVVPALKAGLHCIYIPAIQEWQYNIVEITEEPRGVFLRLQALSEVPEALSQSLG